MPRNCMVCGKWTRDEICARCKELQRLRHEVSDAKDRIKSLEESIVRMRRYTVVTNTTWPNRTWDEALRKADELREKGITFLYIHDERGVKVAKYDEEGFHRVAQGIQVVTP